MATLNALAPVGSAVVTGLAAWLLLRRSAPAADKTADAAMVDAVNARLETLMAGYETSIDGLRTQVSSLEGAVRGLIEHVDGLENALRTHGLPVPARPPYPIVVIPGGKS